MNLLERKCRGTGYAIWTPQDGSEEIDVQQMECRYGVIYEDCGALVASVKGWLDHPEWELGIKDICRKLRRLGTPLMDGDFGELSVLFDPKHFRAVCRLLRPRQALQKSSPRR